jgi:tetratricopeptide (TPR) repeat protein
MRLPQEASALPLKSPQRATELHARTLPPWTEGRPVHALKVNARYVPALVAAAELHIREDHAELALPLLEQAVKIDPNNQTAYYQLTMACRRTGNAEKAEQAGAVFRRLQATEKAPQGSRGLLDYLRTDIGSSPAERRPHYLQYLKTAFKNRPNNPRILARLGVAELEGGETAPAPELLKSALQPSLTFSDALASARAFTAGSQTQLALEFYKHALKQTEAQKDARPALQEAQLLLSLGHPNQALDVLEAVSAQAEPQGRAADLAALILARLCNDSKALAAFRVAISLAPHQPAIYGDTAVFLASRDRWPEALKLLEVAETRCPKSPQLTLNKANLLQLSGHQKDAQETLRSIAFHADDPDLTHDQRLAALLLGISYDTTDQSADAERIFEGLTRADPRLAQAWYYRALLAPAGKSHEALEWVDRSLELDPRSAPALYLRGKLLRAANSGDQPTQSSQLREFLNQLAISSNP